MNLLGFAGVLLVPLAALTPGMIGRAARRERARTEVTYQGAGS